jgi:hypothetical protein
MRKKGIHQIESPEKTSAITTGIEMTRGQRKTDNISAPEYLTGGNGVADESGVKNLIMRFIRFGK